MRRKKISVMTRIRPKDLKKAKELAKQVQKKLPDFWGELLKFYRRKNAK